MERTTGHSQVNPQHRIYDNQARRAPQRRSGPVRQCPAESSFLSATGFWAREPLPPVAFCYPRPRTSMPSPSPPFPSQLAVSPPAFSYSSRAAKPCHCAGRGAAATDVAIVDHVSEIPWGSPRTPFASARRRRAPEPPQTLPRPTSPPSPSPLHPPGPLPD